MALALAGTAALYIGLQAKKLTQSPSQKSPQAMRGNSPTGALQPKQPAQEGRQSPTGLAPSGKTLEEWKKCKARVLPSFINISLSWGHYEEYEVSPGVWDYKLDENGNKIERTYTSRFIKELLKALSPPSVIVVSSGNARNQPIYPAKVQGSKEYDAILVGNMHPVGKRNMDSQGGEELHIMAPSSWYLTSVDKEGDYRRFGGTSGAAPLVTASLAGFELASGYQLSAAESKLLLEKTAIPTISSKQQPRKHGAGLLNTFKMVKVGKRLKKLCGEDRSCFETKLADPAAYDFENKGVPKVLAEVKKAFPECNSEQCSEKSDNCEKKARVFTRLRKKAFLNPNNPELWKALSCVYSSAGFFEESLGYRSFYIASTDTSSAVINDQTCMDEERCHPVDISCLTDEDCVLAPRCSYGEDGRHILYLGPTNLKAIRKNQISICGPLVPCSDIPGAVDADCECGSRVNFQNEYKTAKCVDFQCAVQTQSLENPSEQTPANTEQNSGTTGQR